MNFLRGPFFPWCRGKGMPSSHAWVRYTDNGKSQEFYKMPNPVPTDSQIRCPSRPLRPLKAVHLFSPCVWFFNHPEVSSLPYPELSAPKSAVPTNHGSQRPKLSQNTPFPSKLVILGGHYNDEELSRSFLVTLVKQAWTLGVLPPPRSSCPPKVMWLGKCELSPPHTELLCLVLCDLCT